MDDYFSAQDSVPHLLPKSKAVFQLLAALLHLSCLGGCATPLRNSSHILTPSRPCMQIASLYVKSHTRASPTMDMQETKAG